MDTPPDNGVTEAARSIAEDFSFLDGWEERYSHVIALGRQMEARTALPEQERIDVNLVPGCTSRVWMVCDVGRSGHLIFRGSSDSVLVSGLIAILMALYSHRTASEILAFDAEAFFASIGLHQALTAQRTNGLVSMHRRIVHHARVAVAGSEQGCGVSRSFTEE